MRNQHRPSRAIVCILLPVLGLTADALAGLITIEFQGTLTQYEEIDELGELLSSLGVVPGATLSGSYTFDPSAPDEQPVDPYWGRYAASSLDLEVGLLEFHTNELVITVWNDYGIASTDAYRLVTPLRIPSPPPISDAGYPSLSFSLNLSDPFSTVLNADTLPLEAPDPDLFRFQSTTLRFWQPDLQSHESVGFTLDRLEVIPEPDTLALLTPVAWTLWRQRRRSISSSG